MPVLPLVALAAGSLLGGTLFHLLPESVAHLGNRLGLYAGLAGASSSSWSSRCSCSGTTATSHFPGTSRSAT